MTDKLSVENQLMEYEKKKANILGPAINIGELSQFHKIVVDSVMLSANPADGDVYKYKDAFKGKSAQFIISGKGLQRLAVCAGIAWNPNFTKVTSISHKYVAYVATGCIRKADGQQVCLQAEADVDIDVVIDEIREQFKQKQKKWADDSWFKKLGAEGQADYIETAMTKEINYRKKHKTKIAATDARSRVIRPLLMLQKTYTSDELQRPFVSPRVILAPDYSDPVVKKMMLTAAIQAQTNIFGQTPAQLIEEPLIDIPDSDFHEVLPEVNEPLDGNKRPGLPPITNACPYDDNGKDNGTTGQEVFQDMSALEQIGTLEGIAERKGYEPKQPIEQLGVNDRLKFWEALAKLPDVEKTEKGDIPYENI